MRVFLLSAMAIGGPAAAHVGHGGWDHGAHVWPFLVVAATVYGIIAAADWFDRREPDMRWMDLLR